MLWLQRLGLTPSLPSWSSEFTGLEEGGRDMKLIIPPIFHPVALWLWQREEHSMLGMFDRTPDPLTLPQLALPAFAVGGNGRPCRLHPRRRRLQGGKTGMSKTLLLPSLPSWAVSSPPWLLPALAPTRQAGFGDGSCLRLLPRLWLCHLLPWSLLPSGGSILLLLARSGLSHPPSRLASQPVPSRV